MRPLNSLLCLLLLPSCVHLFTTRVEYAATSPAPEVGGSAFRAEFMPQGKESGIALNAMVIGGAVVAEVGPYQMRMHAFGKESDQRWFEIKSLRLSSKDGFEAPMEPRGFEGRAEFKPTATAGTTRASLLLGPYIRLDAKKQHDIVIDAEVVVMRRGGLSKGRLHMPLSLSKTRRRDSIYVVSELWHDLRHRDSMEIPSALPPPPEHP